MKMDGYILEKKSFFEMLELTFFSKLDWYSKKIGALIRSTKFISPEVALYLYKSSIQPCMEYCCHVWADALNKLQKQICRTVGLSLGCSPEPLAHRRNLTLDLNGFKSRINRHFLTVSSF